MLPSIGRLVSSAHKSMTSKMFYVVDHHASSMKTGAASSGCCCSSSSTAVTAPACCCPSSGAASTDADALAITKDIAKKVIEDFCSKQSICSCGVDVDVCMYVCTLMLVHVFIILITRRCFVFMYACRRSSRTHVA